MSSNTDDRIIVNVAKGSLIQFKDKDTRDDFYFNLQHLLNKDYRDIQKYEVYKKNKELADSPA